MVRFPLDLNLSQVKFMCLINGELMKNIKVVKSQPYTIINECASSSKMFR